jgi:hypothetical protein
MVLGRTRKVYEQSIQRYFFIDDRALIARIFPRAFMNTEPEGPAQYVESVAKGFQIWLYRARISRLRAVNACYVFLRIDDPRQLTDSILKRSDKGKPGKSQGRKAAGPRFLRDAMEDLPKGPRLPGYRILDSSHASATWQSRRHDDES